MKYKVFFEVKLEHAYSPTILEYLIMQPRNSSAKLMRGTGLLVKETGGGFKVLIPVNEEGNDIPVFNADENLSFSLYSTSSDFLEFTDFSATNDGDVALFTNQGLSNNSLDLLVSGTGPNARMNGFPEVGQLQIILNEIDAGTDQEAPVYSVRFDAKSIIWKYYFITKDETASLSVKHKNIAFKKLSGEAVDSVFKRLTTNFSPSGLQIQAFESEEPLACQSSPRKDIQLKNENVTVINHLPNPEVGDRGIKIIRIN